MLKLTKISALLLVSAVWATSTQAGDDIEWRQRNQQKRISDGFRSGQLTRVEYVRLQAEQSRIADLARAASADGVIDPAERAEITRAQQEAGRHIYLEKHDNETRQGYWRPIYRHWWQGF